jgi:hypothetical protein
LRLLLKLKERLNDLASRRPINRHAHARLRRERDALETLYRSAVAEGTEEVRPLAGVVFSRDRATQLHALLTSYALNARGTVPPLHVLYSAGTHAHRNAYEQLFAEMASDRAMGPDVRATPDGDAGFRGALIRILETLDSERVFFLVDDIIFTRPVDFDLLRQIDSHRYVFSLRLGRHLETTYALRQKQPLPSFLRSPHPEFLCWEWGPGPGDWGYPLSLDGHVFLRREALAMIRALPFSAPNSLEGGLCADYAPWFLRRRGLCFPEARLVNVPSNLVQTERQNRHGGVHQDELLEKWRQGLCIDIRPLQGLRNLSAHQEVEFAYVERRSA